MISPEFKYINSFRIDILDFDIYKNDTTGQYLTTNKYNELDSINDAVPKETIYKDFEQLCMIFEDDLSEEHLKEILSGMKDRDRFWSCGV